MGHGNMMTEVEYVTRGRSPSVSVTCSTEGRPISMSHERLCVMLKRLRYPVLNDAIY